MFAFLVPIKHPNFQQLQLQKKNTFEDVLVKGLVSGEEHSIRQLYKMYSPALFGIIKRIVKFDEVAEDVLQDTYVKIWRSITHYEASKGRLFTWMANIAKNTAIDQIRSKSSIYATRTDDICEISPEYLDGRSHFQLNTDTIGIRNLLGSLKSDQKLIIEMIYFKGYTHTQASELLNIPLGTIKTKVRLSILFLRKYFKEAKIPA